MSKKNSPNPSDTWIFGGIFAVLGLYVIITAKSFNDVAGGFFLLGLGLVFMAAVSKEFRRKLFDFFLSIFKGLWKLIGK
jgi:hypothetical protein